MNKKLYIIAGCNGAGKTTASLTILPEILNCKEFVNADAIAVGLSPFQPSSVAVDAGKIMLQRIDDLLNQGKCFAFETTLAARSYRGRIAVAKAKGYHVTLLFFWLQTVELARERVRTRVLEGGHGINTDVIERRYLSGIKNLFDTYLPIVDVAWIYDNSEGRHEIVAKKAGDSTLNIVDELKFHQIKQCYGCNK
ncbi:MAG: zeta toxin [Prevotellaceae bacterium]|jgi:predicted ABC-type ATPase|nr:zeta toxin [Prevotellaceae bacterium]